MSTVTKIVIPGGTGQVGTILARAFHAKGWEVVVLGRTPVKVPWRFVPWDGKNLGAWTGELEGATAVINLAGRSVNCRYSKTNRRLITESRVDSARIVGEAIRKATCPPPVWLQMSTATIYAHRYDAPNDETTGILGGNEPGVPETWRFSIDVAKAWEEAALAAQPPWVRLVLLRSAMVMSPDPGGVFATLARHVKLGLGGRHGDGHQYMSWIHEIDFVRAIELIIADDSIHGPVNLSAPNPLPNADFMTALRQACGVPFGLPTTNAMLEIGTFLLRTETELIRKSRRVVPGLLLQHGFQFQFPEWPAAARALASSSPKAGWPGWVPPMIATAGAIASRGIVPPWIFMWILAVTLFAGFKWWTWWRTTSQGLVTTAGRSFAFLFLWPGMDADRFLALNRPAAKPESASWIFALAKTLAGALLIWGIARLAGNGWGAGWIGMIGFIFFLHFGVFHLLALFWQTQGIDAQPIMRWPALARSLGDFWGKRWNAGFRDLAFGLLFARLAKKVSPRSATMLVFLVSGLIHELVITFPARAGYGLPTLYFTMQGAGMLFERSHLGLQLGLRKTVLGRLFAIAVVAVPVFALFPAPFVLNVMVPFFQAIKALP